MQGSGVPMGTSRHALVSFRMQFLYGGGTESFTGLSPVLPKMSRSMASSSVVQAGKFKAWTLYTWSVLTLMYELETL